MPVFIVPATVSYSLIQDEKAARRAQPATLTGGDIPIETAEPILNIIVCQNTPHRGYELVQNYTQGSSTLSVKSPFGGILLVESTPLVHAVSQESVPFNEIEFQLAFNNNNLILATQKLIESGLIEFVIESRTGISLNDLKLHEVYEIAQCPADSYELNNMPLRFIGAVGEGDAKRGVFINSNDWLIQLRGDTVYRAAPDKAHTVPSVHSVRRASLGLNVLQLALDASWYDRETFSMRGDTDVVLTHSPEWCSYLYGCLLLKGMLTLNANALKNSTRSHHVSFGKKDQLTLKAKTYYRDFEVEKAFGTKDCSGKRGGYIYSMDLKTSLSLTDPVDIQLAAFERVLQEVQSVSTDSTLTRGLDTMYAYRFCPAGFESEGGSRYSLTDSGYLVLCIR